MASELQWCSSPNPTIACTARYSVFCLELRKSVLMTPGRITWELWMTSGSQLIQRRTWEAEELTEDRARKLAEGVLKRMLLQLAEGLEE